MLKSTYENSRRATPGSRILRLIFALAIGSLFYVGGGGVALAAPPAKRGKAGDGKSAPAEKNAKPKEAELYSKRKDITKKISQRRHEREAVKKREGVVRSQIKQTHTKIQQETHSLKKTQAKLARLTEQQRLVAAQKEDAKKKLHTQRNALAARLRDQYERGEARYTRLLLDPGSLVEQTSVAYYTQRIVASDATRVHQIRLHEQWLAGKKQALEARTEQEEATRTALAGQLQREHSFLNRYNGELVKVQTTLKDIEEDLAEMEAASRAIEAQIRMTQLARRGTSTLRGWMGAFVQPVQGMITSRFGRRFHPILSRWMPHNGIDIAAGTGTPIRAAAGGEVIFSGYMGGYGNAVVLDHGGDISTLYAHCSAILVTKGQMVKQSQPIARVGSTGRATGPHLHFEERHRGAPVDPQRRLKR